MKARSTAPVAMTDRKWEVEDALRCMQRAEEIKRDSAMMKDVQKLAAEKQQALKAVARVRTPTSRSPARKK